MIPDVLMHRNRERSQLFKKVFCQQIYSECIECMFIYIKLYDNSAVQTVSLFNVLELKVLISL